MLNNETFSSSPEVIHGREEIKILMETLKGLRIEGETYGYLGVLPVTGNGEHGHAAGKKRIDGKWKIPEDLLKVFETFFWIPNPYHIPKQYADYIFEDLRKKGLLERREVMPEERTKLYEQETRSNWAYFPSDEGMAKLSAYFNGEITRRQAKNKRSLIGSLLGRLRPDRKHTTT